MKTFNKTLVSLMLALLLVLSLSSCAIPAITDTQSASSSSSTNEAPSATNLATSYLAIDINPSIELVIENGKIVSVIACNDDAEVLLSGEDLVGLTTDEATEKIVALAEELGFINDENTAVKITVTSEDDESSAEIEKKAKDGAQRGSSRAIVNSNPRLADEREVKALQDENPELYKDLTPAKLRLIKSIMEFDPEMTIEKGASMSHKELIELLKGYADEFKGMVGDEVREKIKERKEEIKKDKEQKIAEVYGEEFISTWEKLYSVSEFYKEIKKNALNATLSVEDAEAICTLVGEELATALMADELITVDEIEHLFDKKLFERGDELKASIEAILDKYSPDAYVLTEAELARLTEIYGENDATTLGDVKAIIRELSIELAQIKKDAVLDTDKQGRLDEIDKSFEEASDKVGEKIKQDFGSMVDGAIEHFREQKESKRK